MNEDRRAFNPLHQEPQSRRSWIKNMLLLALPAGLYSCKTLENWGAGSSKVNRKYHWLRRQEWTGLEAVCGVVQVGDRFILVQHSGELGWAFPGGLVDPKIHGVKAKDNLDLVRAVTEYVHSQAMMPVIGDDAILLAYGYALDPFNNRTYLQHWFIVKIPGGFPPAPHGNLSDTQDAKWIALDDPFLGRCLQRRIQEYQSIGEGGSIVLEPYTG